MSERDERRDPDGICNGALYGVIHSPDGPVAAAKNAKDHVTPVLLNQGADRQTVNIFFKVLRTLTGQNRASGQTRPRRR